MNIHLLICFITHLHQKVHFKISYQLSGSVFSFQEYICGVRNIEDPHVYFDGSFPSFSEMLITLMLNLLCHRHMSIAFFVQLKVECNQHFRVDWSLCSCLIVLSSCHTWKWDWRKRSLQSSKETIELNIPIHASLVHRLSQYWTSNGILTCAFKGKLLLFIVAYSSF